MIQFETMMLNYIKISLLMKSTKVLVGTLENDLNFEKDKITCENGFHHQDVVYDVFYDDDEGATKLSVFEII